MPNPNEIVYPDYPVADPSGLFVRTGGQVTPFKPWEEMTPAEVLAVNLAAGMIAPENANDLNPADSVTVDGWGNTTLKAQNGPTQVGLEALEIMKAAGAVPLIHVPPPDLDGPGVASIPTTDPTVHYIPNTKDVTTGLQDDYARRFMTKTLPELPDATLATAPTAILAAAGIERPVVNMIPVDRPVLVGGSSSATKSSTGTGGAVTLPAGAPSSVLLPGGVSVSSDTLKKAGVLAAVAFFLLRKR